MDQEFVRDVRRELLRFFMVAIAAGALLGPGTARADDPVAAEDVPEKIVDVMNTIFGKHPGFPVGSR